MSTWIGIRRDGVRWRLAMREFLQSRSPGIIFVQGSSPHTGVIIGIGRELSDLDKFRDRDGCLPQGLKVWAAVKGCYIGQRVSLAPESKSLEALSLAYSNMILRKKGRKLSPEARV